MRIDKFLWCVRKYKTRTLAAEIVKKEKVWVNGEIAKPSRMVKPGDTVELKKEGMTLSFKILDIPKTRMGAKLVENYIQDITPPEEVEKADFIRMMKRFDRKKGSGRPTKKDRRDLDRLQE